MSLIKFRGKRLPWTSELMPTWFDADDLFAEDIFSSSKNLPAMNVKEDKDNFEIELAVPGFSKEDIEVSLEEDLLHVFAQKSKENVEDEKDYVRKEFSYDMFDRKLKLPQTINHTKKVKANYKDGILKLRLAKTDEVKKLPKKMIEIA
jgi:HSP20 family protein